MTRRLRKPLTFCQRLVTWQWAALTLSHNSQRPKTKDQRPKSKDHLPHAVSTVAQSLALKTTVWYVRSTLEALYEPINQNARQYRRTRTRHSPQTRTAWSEFA